MISVRGQVSGGRYDGAVLALDRFQDHQGGVGGDGGPQRVRVPVRHMRHLAGQRQEGVAFAGLPGEGEGAQGAAVEAALGGDHVAPAGAPPDLESGLDGLRAGVGEEDLAGAAEELEEPFGELDGRLGDEEVGDVAEGGDLVGDGADDGGVGVAEGVDGDAADEVEVLAAVGVPDPGALAAHQRQAGVP